MVKDDTTSSTQLLVYLCCKILKAIFKFFTGEILRFLDEKI